MWPSTSASDDGLRELAIATTSGAREGVYHVEDVAPRPSSTLPWLPRTTTPLEVVNMAALDLSAAEVLGRGGQGIVRRIRTPEGTMVFKEDLMPVDAMYYTQDIAIVSALRDCPHVVQYRAVVVKPGEWTDVLVPCGWLLEDLGDMTLQKWIQHTKSETSPSEEDRAERLTAIVGDVARGLQSLHQRGWLHMDIKPSNVMVTSSGSAKLIDLNLAVMGATSRSRAGTDGFRAPEIAFAEAPMPTPASDMWSLGATLQWCLTTSGTDSELLQFIASSLLQPNAALRPTTWDVIEMATGDGSSRVPTSCIFSQGELLIRTAKQFAACEVDAGIPTLPRELISAAHHLLADRSTKAWHCARQVVSVLSRLAPEEFDEGGDADLRFEVSVLSLDVRIASGIADLIDDASLDVYDLLRAGELSENQELVLSTRIRRAKQLLLHFDYDALVSVTGASRMAAIDSCYAKACYCRATGKHLRQATEHFDEILESAVQHSDVASLTTALILVCKANTLVARSSGTPRELRDAVELFDQALTIQRRTVGKHHSSVAATLSDKATALQHFGDRDALPIVLTMYDEALSIAHGAFGYTHPFSAVTLARKADALRKMGERANVLQALALSEESLAVLQLTLNPKNGSIDSARRARDAALDVLRTNPKLYAVEAVATPSPIAKEAHASPTLARRALSLRRAARTAVVERAVGDMLRPTTPDDSSLSVGKAVHHEEVILPIGDGRSTSMASAMICETNTSDAGAYHNTCA